MAINVPSIIMLCLAASFISLAYASSGTSTYNTIYVPSACYGYKDEGKMIAAASDEIWNNGAACGRMYTVVCTGATNKGVLHPCTGNSVTVKIVDRCPSSACQATLDLSEEAFSIIADTAAGKIKIDYE